MKRKETGSNDFTGLEIAVIGMSCRFPGAKSVAEFWDNLTKGIDSISLFAAGELEESGIDPGIARDPRFVNAKGLIEDVEYFDAAFFGYSLEEAGIMDPQARVFHQCIWEALEDSGYDPYAYRGLIGLFSGAAPHAVWDFISFPHEWGTPSKRFADSQLYDKDFMTTRIAYKLNLRGPILTVFTACSTALVAIHTACGSVLSGECDMALAGGVSVSFPLKMGYLYEEGMIFSTDGRHRSFDEKATGSVFGDGAGVVLLKRLEDAIGDRDTIHAVIKGSAVNNDGNRKLGYPAPSVEGQAEVIRSALQMAQIDPGVIGYIETHGSATYLGDVVEIEALSRVFHWASRAKNKRFPLGSVKSNVGHLNTAAGMAGFIKTAAVLKHRLIPPQIHFETPNSKIDFENTPFYVNTCLQEWKDEGYPFRAGVSSFGIGGTNVHVILEEPPLRATSPGGREWKLLVLAAKTPASLEQASKNLSNFLEKNPEVDLADAAYTLAVGRAHFRCRRVLVCSTREQAIEILSAPDPGTTSTHDPQGQRPGVVFMFPGLGAQYEGMGEGLYRQERVFREEMDRCFALFQSIAGYDLREIIYPALNPAPVGGRVEAPGERGLKRTEIAQPAVFIFEYALAKLLMDWGIVPTEVIGYSFGEYAAACISGVMTLEDALALAIWRGRLMARESISKGAMTSVPLPFNAVGFLPDPRLSITVDNGPSCIVGGPAGLVETFEAEMKKKGILCVRVKVPHAAHSLEMAPLLAEFAAVLENIPLKEPRIPYVSSITGERAVPGELISHHYWETRLVECIRFGPGLNHLLKTPGTVFIEVGPGRDLCLLAKEQPDYSPSTHFVNPVRSEKEEYDDSYYLLKRVGLLWLNQVDIHWPRFYADEKRYRIPLPTTAFEGQYFAGDANCLKPGIQERWRNSVMSKKDAGVYWYVPLWKRSPLSPTPDFFVGSNPGWVMVFMDELGIGDRIVALLMQQGIQVTRVQPGRSFRQLGENSFAVNPSEAKDYEALSRRLSETGQWPDTILHLWTLTPEEGAEEMRFEREEVEKNQVMGYYSLIALAQALGKQSPPSYVQVKVVSNNILDVTGGEVICAAKATILGPVMVIPDEYDHIRCCLIDIPLLDFGGKEEQELIERLVVEIKTVIREARVAFRHKHRWIQTYEKQDIPVPEDPFMGLKQRGVYLVTGGLGGIGLKVAEFLAVQVKARLILTGRSDFPCFQEWDAWISRHGEEERTSSRILQIRRMEALGAEVIVESADVSDFSQMKKVVARAEERFGSINGVIHAAGVPDGALIFRRTREMSEDVFSPKISGVLVLEKLFRGASLDFIILFSSIASILGAPGQVAYVGANAFLDAFASCRVLKNGGTPISINWDRWRNLGIAKIAEAKHLELSGEEMPGGLTVEEGIDGFRRVLASSLPRLVVTPGDLKNTINFKNLQLCQRFSGANYTDPLHLSPVIQKRTRAAEGIDVSYKESRNDLERSLAEVMAKILGVEQIGLDDNFFDLNATSLQIIQATSMLKKSLKIDIPVITMFNYPTIATLVRFLEQLPRDN
ncbi:SDR family NAD(P)-dependent oxidoreductase [Acidobacteriota bacterium]